MGSQCHKSALEDEPLTPKSRSPQGNDGWSQNGRKMIGGKSSPQLSSKPNNSTMDVLGESPPLVLPASLLHDAFKSLEVGDILRPTTMLTFTTADDPIKAFSALIERDVHSAPVLDVEEDCWLGSLDVQDLTQYIVQLYAQSENRSSRPILFDVVELSLSDLIANFGDGSATAAEFAAAPTIKNKLKLGVNAVVNAERRKAAAEKVVSLMQGKVLARDMPPAEQAMRGLSSQRPVETVRTTENLLVVAEKLAGGCRRVAVTDEEGRAVSMLSRSRLISFINIERNMFMAQRAEDQCGCHDGDGQPPEDMFVGNVSQWGVVKGQVKSVTTEHTLIRALAELVKWKVNSVAIVDHSGALVAVLTTRILKCLLRTEVQWAVAEKTLGQLLLEDDTLLMQGGAVVGPSDPISAVFEAMDRHRVHRVFVLDASNRPIGVISIKDLLNAMLNGPKMKVREQQEKLLATISPTAKARVTEACFHASQVYCCDGTPLGSAGALLQTPHIRKLWLHLPRNVRHRDWRRLYSMNEDGASLRTLYRSCEGVSEPCVLAIEDSEGMVFGCFTNGSWKVDQNTYGNGQCFVFRFNGHHEEDWAEAIEAFRWEPEHKVSLFQQGQTEHIAIGDGPAIWLDAQLMNGRSEGSQTFGTPGPLTSSPLFQVRNVEVWGLGWRPVKSLEVDQESSIVSPRNDSQHMSSREVEDGVSPRNSQSQSPCSSPRNSALGRTSSNGAGQIMTSSSPRNTVKKAPVL